MNSHIFTCDILIIGAGPSGLSTALHLAQIAPHLIPRILILEKAHHPRQKLCAGGLVIDAEILLQHLGLDVSEIPHTDVEAAHLDFAGQGLTIRMRNTHALRIIRRNEFDAWLVQHARQRGLEIREGILVKDLEPQPDGVRVKTNAGIFMAQVVVGADGSNGVTRRSILPDVPLHTARVLEVLTPEANSASGLDSNGSHGKYDAYFDFFPVPDGIAGYTWDFPTRVDGQAMRCWGIYDTNVMAGKKRPALKDPLAQEMSRHGLELDQFDLKGHPIRWFSPFNQFAVRRVLLVGDAAGADGIFGEGISMALGYGWVAARAIRDAFVQKDFSFKNYRIRLLLSPLGRALTVRTAVTQILYRLHWSWFQKFFWRTFKPVVAGAAFLWVLNWGKRMH